ncbi:MAG: hypothetical protein IJZ30_04725 [Alphaproteobacteria bacterium]|nr:hypothetical protein [Alphaproteobacteria bacterium]
MISSYLHIFIKKLLKNKNLCGFVVFCATLFVSFYCYAEADEEYIKECLQKELNKSTDNAGCWSCQVVQTLMQGLTNVTGVLYEAIRSISETVLLYGGAIWIACYFLKTLGSFAAQTPGKVLDGLMIFVFKWSLCYATIYVGLDGIVEYIVQPLLDIGYSIGTEFNKSTGIGGK